MEDGDESQSDRTAEPGRGDHRQPGPREISRLPLAERAGEQTLRQINPDGEPASMAPARNPVLGCVPGQGIKTKRVWSE